MKIGKNSDGKRVTCDPAKLIDTRLLVQGSSGSGKSWVIRKLIEGVSQSLPVIVLDLEGEFVTLREKVDLVIAGDGGEVAVDVRSASLLARKLLELNVSAVVDLFDLNWPQRRAYVRAFLESMMTSPRELWGSRLVVIDEAHQFAPESSKSEALGAVADLASRGRKRGFGLVAATQRLSKLHKDVAAELRNVMVGQTTLDVDVKRGLDAIGMPGDLEHKRRLRSLEHEFFAFGPALSCDGVELITVDKPKTTHPTSGSRRDLEPPAPSRKIAAVLGELEELPEKAEAEAKSLAEAKAEIARLKRQIGKPQVVADDAAIDRAVAKAEATRDRHWKGEIAKLEKSRQVLAGRLTNLAGGLDKLRPLATANGEATVSVSEPASTPTARTVPQPVRDTGTISAEGINKTERNVMRALWWMKDDASQDRAKLAFLAGYSPRASTVPAALTKLRAAGLVEGSRLTAEGEAAMVDVAPKPTGAELREWLRTKLGSTEMKVLDFLYERPGESFSNAEIAEATGYSPTASTVPAALTKLRKYEAVEGGGREGAKAASVFFD